eukprot:2570761-Prymnesium_polylepis.2
MLCAKPSSAPSSSSTVSVASVPARANSSVSDASNVCMMFSCGSFVKIIPASWPRSIAATSLSPSRYSSDAVLPSAAASSFVRPKKIRLPLSCARTFFSAAFRMLSEVKT